VNFNDFSFPQEKPAKRSHKLCMGDLKRIGFDDAKYRLTPVVLRTERAHRGQERRPLCSPKAKRKNYACMIMNDLKRIGFGDA